MYFSAWHENPPMTLWASCPGLPSWVQIAALIEMHSGISSFGMVRLYLVSLMFACSWTGSPCDRLACEVIPTSMATRLPSNTALVMTSPARSRCVSPNVSSLLVVGSMVLATTVLALATAEWPLVASDVAQHPAWTHCTSNSSVTRGGLWEELAPDSVANCIVVDIWW